MLGPIWVLGFAVLFYAFQCTFQQALPTSRNERSALLLLRSSLGLRAQDWPRKSDPCTTWAGIQCRNGSVVQIDISGFRRTRLGKQNPQFSVDALANLTSLEIFNSSRFALPGPIPGLFGSSLKGLQVLDLRSCSVSGTIPLSIGNLTNLTSLYFSDNNLTGTIPYSLGQLTRLSILDLSRNFLTGSIPISILALGNLSFVDISSNILSGSIPSGIGTLSNLRSLNISNNNLSSSIPPQLGGLARLVNIDLSSNSISGPLPLDLRGLRNLQKINVRNNKLVGMLSGSLFSGFNSLDTIVLSENEFNGSVPGMFWSIASLRFVDFSNNNFTGNLPNSTLNDSPVGAVFNISGNMFYGNIPITFRPLGLFDLSKNYFEGEVPDYAQFNSSLDLNCLRNVSKQRTLVDCESFYAERNLNFDDFGRPNIPPPPHRKSSRKKSRIKWIILGVSGSVGLIVLLSLLFICWRRKSVANQGEIDSGPVPAINTNKAPLGDSINYSILGEMFTYEQMLLATGEFSDTNLIKHGHSGDFFRGVLESGIQVVIKRVDLNSVKEEFHLSELECFSKASHARLVPLVGYCLENEDIKLLVYKYMPNGDLSNSLYKKTDSDNGSIQSLDWITRLKVAIGSAEGLIHLHHDCTPALVHRDVQASSILLDDKFEVRLGSLSEACAHEGDTHQKSITRFLRMPQTILDQGSSGSATANCAYDVYCFGKVLLELVTGKVGMSGSNQATVKEWLDQTLPFISIQDKELVTKIVDPTLIIDEDHLEEVWAMSIVAKSCLNPKPSRRPQMRYIVKALENPLKVVRENSSSSGRLRTTSSGGYWNTALFGSWRHSISENVPETSKAEGSRAEAGSQGSGHNATTDFSSSQRRHAREVFPEPEQGRPSED